MKAGSQVRETLVYRGEVQGVGFRATASSVASRFDVSGFVKNQLDGTVLLIVEGSQSEVLAFRQAVASQLRHRIAGTDRTSEPATGEFEDFSIRR